MQPINCSDKNHNPPTNKIYKKPLVYICPSCGGKQTVKPTIIKF